MNPNPAPPNTPIPDAEHLYAQLRQQLRDYAGTTGMDDWVLIGIHRGGAWLAERLAQDVSEAHTPWGSLDISFYRDDFATTGVRTGLKTTDIPFAIEGKTVVLCDDVLNSGRSVRAALNELFEFGRPKQVLLAVLFDRGERQLPIAAQFMGGAGVFDAAFKLALERDERQGFCFRVPRRAVRADVAQEVV